MSKTMGLKDELVRVVAAQAQRYSDLYGRPDSSGFESYGKVKDKLEKLLEAVKPLQKSLTEFWKKVSAGDEELQLAFIREIESEAMNAAADVICLCATACRAVWSMDPWNERKVGQMSFDDLMQEMSREDEPEEDDPEEADAAGQPREFEPVPVDEDTGEVLADG